MFKKIFSSLILFVFVFSFSACRTKEPVQEDQDYTGIELTYYKMYDDAEVIEPLIQEYLKDRKGLKINYKQFVDFDEYLNTVVDEMAEGEGPDIFSMQNTWFYTNYKKLSPLPENLGSPSVYDQIFADVASVDLIRTDQFGQNQIYAMPMYIDTLAIYYNEEYFDDAIPSRGQPADTWEQLREDVKALNKEDNSFSRFLVSAVALGRADNVSRAVDVFYLLLLQNDIDFYNSYLTQVDFLSSPMKFESVVEFVLSFSDENSEYYSWNEYLADANSYEKEVKAFARGDVAMIFGYSYTYDDIINQIKVLNSRGVDVIDEDVVKTSEIPQIAGNKGKRVAYASYFAETVSRNCEYPELAWDFIIFMTKYDNLDYYFEKTHKPTSRRDMIELQSQDEIFGVFADQIGVAESFPILDYFEYKDLFVNMFNDLNSGLDILDSAEYVEEQINNLIPEDGYYIEEQDVVEEDGS